MGMILFVMPEKSGIHFRYCKNFWIPNHVGNDKYCNYDMNNRILSNRQNLNPPLEKGGSGL